MMVFVLTQVKLTIPAEFYISLLVKKTLVQSMLVVTGKPVLSHLVLVASCFMQSYQIISASIPHKDWDLQMAYNSQTGVVEHIPFQLTEAEHDFIFGYIWLCYQTVYSCTFMLIDCPSFWLQQNV